MKIKAKNAIEERNPLKQGLKPKSGLF